MSKYLVDENSAEFDSGDYEPADPKFFWCHMIQTIAKTKGLSNADLAKKVVSEEHHTPECLGLMEAVLEQYFDRILSPQLTVVSALLGAVGVNFSVKEE